MRSLKGFSLAILTFATLGSLAAACDSEDTSATTTTSSASGGSGGTMGPTGPTGPSTSNTGGNTPVACEPGNTSGFVPMWRPSTGLDQGQCTDTQIEDLYTECLGAFSTQEKCNAFGENAANQACIGCAFAEPSQAVWGPLVIYEDDDLLDGNAGQCVSAFEGDSSSASCGAKIAAANDCAFQACIPNCPVSDVASLNAFLACYDEAAANGCKPFQDAADACQVGLIGMGDPIDQCIWDDENEEFEVYAKRLMKVHCGSPDGAGGGGGAGGSGGGATGGGGAGTGGAGGSGGAGGAGGGS